MIASGESEARLLHGDALEQLRLLEDESVDALVTDPPAGIAFMAKEWDSFTSGRMMDDAREDRPQAFPGYANRLGPKERKRIEREVRTNFVESMTEIFSECFRVLKPGAHALVWALPRTSHWTAWALEDAGFEPRDVVMHIFGQGFPKNHNVSGILKKNGEACSCETAADLPAVRQLVPSEVEGEDEALQPGVLRQVAVYESRNTIAHEVDSDERSYGGEQSGEPLEEDKLRGGQRIMEGRGDVFPQAWQLQADKVRSLPGGLPCDGAEGWLCNGAPSNHGANDWEAANQNGGGSSPGSRSAEQSPVESSVVRQQPRSQTCGRCGKPQVADGLGTALKPSAEHWILVRKPLSERNIAANVLKHGTGAINVDACRIRVQGEEISTPQSDPNKRQARGVHGQDYCVSGDDVEKMRAAQRASVEKANNPGRWPANVVLSHSRDCTMTGTARVKGSRIETPSDRNFNAFAGGGLGGPRPSRGIGDEDGMETVEVWDCAGDCPVRILDEQSGIAKSAGGRIGKKDSSTTDIVPSGAYQKGDPGFGDVGGASRFFYVAKPTTDERNVGLDERDAVNVNDGRDTSIDNPYQRGDSLRKNTHPTVKSVELMQYLCMLITPPGGTVLDCFMGSGTTGMAALSKGFKFVGVEREPEYFEIASARIKYVIDAKARGFELSDFTVARESIEANKDQLDLFGGLAET